MSLEEKNPILTPRYQYIFELIRIIEGIYHNSPRQQFSVSLSSNLSYFGIVMKLNWSQDETSELSRSVMVGQEKTSILRLTGLGVSKFVF